MFLKNFPCLKVGSHLVIADLHLGISTDLYRKGFTVPSQSEALAKRINKIMKKTKTSRLIIVGDLKHSLLRSRQYEQDELFSFLSRLRAKKIILTKGNHDGKIEHLLHEFILSKRLTVRPSLRVGNYLFTHGHRKTEKAKTIVIGHNHPNIKFKDRFGSIYTEPVWVKGYVGEANIIIMPAFNELSGAVHVNESGFLGPIAKRIKNANAFLLDGTDLGLISKMSG